MARHLSPALLVGLFACAVPAAERPAPRDAVTGLPLAVELEFDDASALELFEFSDPSAWRWRDGSLELTGDSDYEPPQRSPRSIAVLAPHAFEDFVLEADLMQTGREYGHRDLCLFLAFRGPTAYTYVHLATTPDANAHNVFLVDDAPRRPLAPVAEVGVQWGTEVWHRVRLERRAGRIRVFFDDLEWPILDVADTTHGAGRVGLGSFDDRGRFDGLRVWGRPEAPEAATLFEL